MNVNDPYYLSARIPFGIYKNQLINTRERKAITILDQTAYADDYPRRINHWTVANIYHNNAFYVAHVPKNAVLQVLFLLEPFGVALAHTMIRFKFSEPIYLIAKTPDLTEFNAGIAGEVLEKPILLKNLLLTVEATAPPGVVEFAAVASFFYTRGLAMRFISLTGRGVHKYLYGGSNVLQYKLNFSIQESNDMFETALRASHKRGMDKMYQTLFANCNWFVFNMLESSKNYLGQSSNIICRFVALLRLIASKLIFFSRVYPPLAKFGLTWRKWRNLDEKTLPNLEQEPEFLQLAKTHSEYLHNKEP